MDEVKAEKRGWFNKLSLKRRQSKDGVTDMQAEVQELRKVVIDPPSLPNAPPDNIRFKSNRITTTKYTM
jgi:hypothetical protein